MKTDQPHTVVAGRYELAEELGRSDAGASWRATDTVLHRSVVVELLHPDLVSDPAFGDRFGRETRALASVVHPGLARLLDAGSEGGVYFVVREDVEGRSLRSLLEADGPLPVGRAVEVTRAVLEALAQIHRVGVLHQDVDPDDVMVEPGGRVRLCSAGLSGAIAFADGSRASAPTPVPERVRGAPPDPRTDVWGAGALLFQLLTGSPPAGAGASARSIRRDVTRPLDLAIGRALADDPEERFPSVEAFDAALVEAAAQLHTPHAPASAGPPAVRRASLFRTWLAVPLLVAVVAVAAVAAGFSLGRLELGGPVGIRLKDEGPSPPAPVPRVLSIASVRTADPFGDGHENDSGAELAVDGDPSTAWRSENYFDGQLHKPGMALVFDLGTARTVTGFRLSTPYPGFGFRVLVGDDPEAMTRRPRGPSYTADGDQPVTFVQPERGRYVLLWITSVVPVSDGNRAEVSEFGVLGMP